ncbi:MAG: C1 family peptidase [Bacteriovorax sp.]
MKVVTAAFLCALLSGVAFSQDEGAFLDSKYPNLVHPTKSKNIINKVLPASDTKEVISYQSPVRSQAARGTCSIFSSTAYLEGLLIKKGTFNNTIDLSEEWLQYTAVRNKTSDGSSGSSNFAAIREYGMPSEQSFPYIGEDWTEVFNPLKDERCGKLKAAAQKSCLIVHRDPALLALTDAQIMSKYSDKEFVNARKEAQDFKTKNIKFTGNNFSVSSIEEVKSLLQKGIPVVLEVDFYYGAWNHREADEFAIGRNMDHWSKGIIAYPETGSMDAEESPKHPSGHSILIVGYDDNKIIEKTIKMTDGSTKKFTYKGVYYFKNSWGVSNFGRDFEIDGEKYPGYGMMVQKYAEELGQFFQMPLQ